jgi:hypothetical protein
MNRYRQAVVEMDARRHWRMRVMTVSVAAVAAALALWAANVQFGGNWLGRSWQGVKDWWANDWFPEQDPTQAIPPQLPNSVVGNVPAQPVGPLPGTDASGR